MPITISGSTGIAGVDGSASTPAVQGTDTNTGIFFPAADTIAFGEGGSEAMRIDSSGNVGIGTSSPGEKLNVNSGAAEYAIQWSSTGSDDWVLASATNRAYITNKTTSVETFTILDGGNVGIGTSSPGSAYRLAVSGNNTGMSIQDTGSVGTWLDFKTGSGTVQGNIYFNFTNGYMTFGTAAAGSSQTERMRIDSNGNLQIGTTTDRGRATISWNSLSQQGLSLITTSTTFNGNPIVFYNSSAGVSGFIGQAAGSVSYNTSSDYRLKHDVQPLVGGLATVAALKPSTYKWNADNSPGEGFIAHELQAIIPQAVSGEKDAVNDDGSIKPQGVDYSKIVVHLVAAIQELKADNDAMKERIATLEAK